MSKFTSPDVLAEELSRQTARLALSIDEATRRILATSVVDLADLLRTYDERPQSLIFVADQRPKYGPGG